MAQQYLFGDTDLAARRLAVLAGAFDASSRAFVADVAGRGRYLAVDLGCGPGYTTHTLAAASQCARAVGLDKSESFIRLADKTATSTVSFRLHDVTTTPFPCGLCELMYGRFLLTHQTDPEALVGKWAAQLRPGGRLLVEEADSISTQSPVFAQYLAIVEAMLADAGHTLYVGPGLARMAEPGMCVKLSDRVAVVPIANALAAKMFTMNIQTWRHNAFVRETYSSASVHRLAEALAELAANSYAEEGVEWRLRQLVFERKGRCDDNTQMAT